MIADAARPEATNRTSVLGGAQTPRRNDMNHFLAKTDPETYSLEHLERDRQTVWDGVRNPQAVRAIRQMRPGDRVYIYHSGGQAAVVGVAEVIGDPRPDPNDARSAVVELRFVRRLKRPVTLAEIKQSGQFADWALVRQGRLSTMPAPPAFAAWVEKLG
jgi:predicted RNA-binding protein with PUA-like domain